LEKEGKSLAALAQKFGLADLKLTNDGEMVEW